MGGFFFVHDMMERYSFTLHRMRLTERTIGPAESKMLDLTLRVAFFGEFFGHGVFAWQLKKRFLEMLEAMIGVSGETAEKLMRAIGAVDMAAAVLVLFYPVRIVLAGGTLWALATAIARPVAGDPIWDFVERWANVGVPLALLLVRGWPKTSKEWFR